MAKKHNHESVDTNIESLSKAEAFITKNNKKIVGGIVLVVALVIGFIVFDSMSEQKKIESQEQYTLVEDAALNAIDSLTNAAALADLEQYINEFGSKAVASASFEAGITAFEVKDYEKAIKYFSEYESEDATFNARAIACIADCYVELGNYEEAYKNYALAVAEADNDLAAEYAFRAGLVAEKLGNNDKAVAMYTMIKEKYPTSLRAEKIEKYISRAEAK